MFLLVILELKIKHSITLRAKEFNHGSAYRALTSKTVFG